MYSIIVVVLLLRIAPLFIGGSLTLEDAYNVCRMSDMLIIILLSWYVYLTIPRDKYIIKVVSMITLVVSACYLINYITVNTPQQGYELIGLGNG